MRLVGGFGSRGLALKFAIIAVSLLFLTVPVYAKGQTHATHAKHTNYKGGKWDPVIQQMVVSGCDVSSSVQSCQGGYNTTQTFGSPLPVGDVVTLTVTYAADTASNAALTFSDTLGNRITVVSQQCTPTAPTLCTAVAYFVVTKGGYDDIFFGVVGGTPGCVHYTAEDWYAANSGLLAPLGTKGYCNGTCSSTLAMAPIVFSTAPSEAIAVGTSEAYFSGQLVSWTPSMGFYYYGNCAYSTGGYGLLMQATNSTATSYAFSSTSTPVATMFAGSAEVLYV